MRHHSKQNLIRKNVLVGSLVVLLVGVVIFLIWHTFFTKPSIPMTYFPKESFKIPEEILRERIATFSAKAIRVPIIMYHYVEYVDREKDPTRANLSISPSLLEYQIKSLVENNYNFLFAKDIPGLIKVPQKLPTKPIVLTFDDGYEDFYWNALPILKKYNVKATIYVMADYIGRRGYLNLAELDALRDSGLVEIGAHTLNHTYLKDMKFDVAKKEIFESKSKLEKLLGISVPSFAYPYGAFSKETLDLTKAAGFTNAVSVIPGINQAEDNIYYLFRLRPGYLGGFSPAKTLEAYK